MTEKEVPVEYEFSDEELESIDQDTVCETDDEYDDKPCISTCCCCCNLGLGSIMAGVIFMVSTKKGSSVKKCCRIMFQKSSATKVCSTQHPKVETLHF